MEGKELKKKKKTTFLASAPSGSDVLEPEACSRS